MGFFDFIERQRQKPEMDRRRILVATSILATAAIAAIWLSTFSFGGVLPEDKKTAEEKGPIDEIVATSEVLVNNMKGALDSFKTIFASSTPQFSTSSSLSE